MTIEEAKMKLIAYKYFAAKDIPPAVAQALDTVIKAVDCTRWIPVSERLPECWEDRYFLCICNKEDKLPYILQYENGLGFGIRIKIPVAPGRYESEFDTVEKIGCEKVSFWLPLPEPYHIAEERKKEGDSEWAKR